MGLLCKLLTSFRQVECFKRKYRPFADGLPNWSHRPVPVRKECANSAHSPGPVGRIIGISVKLVGMASRATT